MAEARHLSDVQQKIAFTEFDFIIDMNRASRHLGLAE